MDIQGADNQIRTGQKLLIVCLALILISELITTLADSLVFAVGMMFWEAHLLRTVITGILCFFVYTGRVWARWLIAILLGLTGGVNLIVAVLIALKIVSGATSDPIYVLLSFVTAVTKIAAVVLLFLPDMARFLAYQKARRIQQWGEDIHKGREKVIGVIIITLSVSLFSIVFYNMMAGPDRIPQQVVRFILTLVLCFFMYSGHKWARLLFGVLYLLAVILTVVSGLVILFTGMISGLTGVIAGLLIFLMGIIYTICVGIIFLSPRVALFFEYQQGLLKRTP